MKTEKKELMLLLHKKNQLGIMSKFKFFKAFEENGDEIGGLYLDIHPRETKQAGGWMAGLVNGHYDCSGVWNFPIATICTNLTPSTESSPSLLSHREVETLFHEFGHALHHLFGKVKFESMNGCHVAWDFVELPSQIMENFCWDRTSLDMFAKHYITGEKIPDELFEKMSKARNHLSASSMMNQLCFSKLDLELHQNFEKYYGNDIEELETMIHKVEHELYPRTINELLKEL